MTLLAPLALTALLAIPAIVLIHYLRGSRRRLRVPDTALWRGLAPGLTARNRLRRPPISLLLLLQLLAAAALGAALSRPVQVGDVTRHVAVVIDASASMQASDVPPSRFEAALNTAAERIASLADDDRVTLIRAGAQPTAPFSGRPRDALAALRRIEPGSADGALGDGVLLAGATLDHTPGVQRSILVVTDGALAPGERLDRSDLPIETITVGTGAGNQAIVVLETRVEPSSGSIDVFVDVANYDERPIRVPLQLMADDLPAGSRQLDVPARGRAPAVFTVPLATRRVTGRLGGRDALRLDDLAEAAAPGVRPRSIVLVTNGAPAVERALLAIPAARILVMSPGEYDGRVGDLTVLDGAVPRPLPPGPLLVVHPPGDNELAPLLGELRLPPITIVDATHPLLTGVDVNALRLLRADRLSVPVWAHTVLGSPRGPLVLEGQRDGRPITLFAFDPTASGVDKSIAFPVLVSNAVSSMLATSAGPAVRPGQIVTIPVTADGRPAVVLRPGGQREQLATAGGVRYQRTEQVGRYLVQEQTGQRPLRVFSVSLLDAIESDIVPRIIENAPARELDAENLVRAVSELWKPLAAAGLALLVIEWLVFARRG